MENEIQQLRQALLNSTPSTSSSNQFRERNDDVPNPSDWEAQLSDSPSETVNPPPIPFLALPQQSPGRTPATSSSAPYRILGDVGLTIGQVTEHFKTYFGRCHRYLPFKMRAHSADDIYSKCPLLFWVICAVTSSLKSQFQLAPMIQAMIADILHSSAHSIETVQALLILCMWPFRITKLIDDPSYFYCGLATQIGLQLGLHRPNQTHSHHYSAETNSTGKDDEVKLTTWLACFVVNQMQSSCLGIPPSTSADFHLLKSFDNPAVDSDLSQLCRIYQLLSQSTLAISVNGSTPSGMLESDARLNMMKLCGEQLSELQVQHLENMSIVVKIHFLCSRLQLWSFALLGDMYMSKELQDIIKKAEDDACEIIELCYGMNLTVAPYHICRAICYSAVALARIIRLAQTTRSEVLEDIIERVRHALSSASSSEDDIINKASVMLRKLPYLEDRRRSPPILSRMGASLLYDSMKMCWENSHESRPNDQLENISLDGFDWSSLAL
ncbi:uncharacterized protein Z518_09783 [Rhinocladiella mackenziei CBS 650.93]|uniref:Xylanolytic transcriptional activator regulatory domain-containing protein n=1 Tax=Rhinocladiella mackenziei CBS 650.93 TaxID=1442369 RepID=A0A0D2GQX6_9EURO|nr:uncharacterized protein Z518_09783 [Rhinocladiella mackenziei CBS 650.93]KIX00718.1 hypothetical protein Z518_09783 [Rhinocladiella mackenziei CBS 650.93]